jgi:hypothetical protein
MRATLVKPVDAQQGRRQKRRIMASCGLRQELDQNLPEIPAWSLLQ